MTNERDIAILMADGYTKKEAVKTMHDSIHPDIWENIEELARLHETTPEAIRSGEHADLRAVMYSGHEYGLEIIH